MADLILFWHRRDLRISDNLGLAAARERSPKVVGVFCLDPGILEADDVAPARVAYMLGCVAQLQERYQAVGSELLILKGNPVEQIPQTASTLGAMAVYWNRDVEPYSRQRDNAVAAALTEKGIEMRTKTWDQLLHAPGDVLTGAGKPYTVYGPFWRNWQNLVKLPPAATLQGAVGLSDAERGLVDAIALPSAKALGFTWDAPLPLEPGERAARAQLEFFGHKAIEAYDEQRNFPAVTGTSLLSAALKFGAVGMREVWQTAMTAYDACNSDEGRTNVQTWMKELAWREFYQHVMFFFPELAHGPYRDAWKDFPWDNDEEKFAAWCEGRTGYPIVDAAMRQLNETGWMHNRCRMIVASFLTKDLIVDWRWGEKYFMQKLVDGDLSANNGGWQWSASSGMDPKPLRIFNPASQAKKFDADADYIRQWLPEIRHVDTGALVSGKLSPLDLEGTDYAAPIVDHKKQQAVFKERYKEQKAKVEALKERD
ncbi:deoxyribodipyrimidine photolyase [Leptolyngbyaceae cyanobacterium CCMR0082]|uniref:Deoxyribodipyrimidine photo-lyase n=2 Tax=Adonisia turfae TaxID=2950184 RepID=A0A6M0SCS7_9CYAN|nr:FAD-binding domain-containing protein [Adonisia turfae]NEZ66295.1 deoxyribodipyrimidine photolyase [Adonisia turfae CCMR0082]